MKRLIFIYLVFLISCQKEIPQIVVPTDIDGHLEVNDELIIGEEIVVEVRIDDMEEDQNACIVFSSSLQDQVFCQNISGGVSQFIIPKEVNTQSGIVTISLMVNQNELSRYSNYISAGPPVDIMEGFIGAKTLITDDDDPAMLVVIPIDAFNNFCEDSTDVVINSIDTRNRSFRSGKLTEEGLTYNLYDGLKITSKTSIGAVSGDAFMMEKELKHVPGEPVYFTLKTNNVYPYADGRQTFDISTSVIRDQFGNVVADGTVIDYIVDNKKGLSRYGSITTNGISNMLLRNPDETVNLSIHAEVDGEQKSRQVKVFFNPYIVDFAISYNEMSKVVEIGPISGALGQIIPDGTEVNISLSNDLVSKMINVQSFEGYVRIDPRDYSVTSGTYQCVVNISSNKKTVQISI